MSIDDSVMIEILRAVRNDTATLRGEMHLGFVDLAARLSRVEIGIAGVRREAAPDSATNAHHQVMLDRMNERIERIERRLDLVDEPPQP